MFLSKGKVHLRQCSKRVLIRIYICICMNCTCTRAHACTFARCNSIVADFTVKVCMHSTFSYPDPHVANTVRMHRGHVTCKSRQKTRIRNVRSWLNYYSVEYLKLTSTGISSQCTLRLSIAQKTQHSESSQRQKRSTNYPLPCQCPFTTVSLLPDTRRTPATRQTHPR